MQNNYIKILGGFLNSSELKYKNGVFKGLATHPNTKKIITISFSEQCIADIRRHEHIQNNILDKNSYFSIILTDGRELKVAATEQTFKEIYNKFLSSHKAPTLIIEEPFNFFKEAKWIGVVTLVLGCVAFLSSNSKTKPVEQSTSFSATTDIPTVAINPVETEVSKTNISINKVCNFENFDITSWKDSSGNGSYTCSSNPFDVSPEKMDYGLPNYLMYAAHGSRNHVEQVKIYLYINNTTFQKDSTKKFIEACNLLSTQISGEKIPKKLVNAIQKKGNASSTVNGISVIIETEIWENRNSYKQNCILRSN